VSEKLGTFRATLPALPAPEVATERVPPLFIVNVGVFTVIAPALPVLDAVLNSPVPAPEIVAEFDAVTIKSPPCPALDVLLSTLAPPVCVKLLTFSAMLPASPAPEVATEIVPPSPIVSVGVVTVISPALPVFDAVLNSPLGELPLPEIEAEFAALTVTLPP
jgi:hypothetical protein